MAVHQHLVFVQEVISRMAAGATTIKGWCLTVATASFGYALANGAWSVAALGVASSLIFASLDARYLREERKYRCLYAGVVRGDVEAFTMDASHFSKRGAQGFSKDCGWAAILKSWSIWSFYGPVVALGSVVAWRMWVVK